MADSAFEERLAAATATPGGGAAAARVGRFASSLLQMVVGITLPKTGDEARRRELEALLDDAVQISRRFEQLEGEDMRAFEGFMAALRLPRRSDTERAKREAAKSAAATEATRVPLATLENCLSLLKLAVRLRELDAESPLRAQSDLWAAVEFTRATYRATRLNVDANLPFLTAAEAERAATRCSGYLEQLEKLYSGLLREC